MSQQNYTAKSQLVKRKKRSRREAAPNWLFCLCLVESVIKTLTLRAEIETDNHCEHSHNLLLAHFADNSQIAKHRRQQNGNDWFNRAKPVDDFLFHRIPSLEDVLNPLLQHEIFFLLLKF